MTKSQVSRRAFFTVAGGALAGAAAAAPALQAGTELDADLLAAVAAYRAADAAFETAEGEAFDDAVKRMQQAMETLIATQARTPQGAALKASVIVGGDLAYVERGVSDKDLALDERLAFSVVRDLHLMGGSAR